MSVSRHRRSYHGNFVGSSPCQVLPSPQALPLPSPVMSFPPSHSSSPATSYSGGGGGGNGQSRTPASLSSVSSTSTIVGVSDTYDEAGGGSGIGDQFPEMMDLNMNECNGFSYNDPANIECEMQGNLGDQQPQPVGDVEASSAGSASYIGGRFRAYEPQSSSWHQPVVDGRQQQQAHLYHPLQASQSSASSTAGSSVFVPPPQMSSMSGSGYGNYENRMSTMMAPHCGSGGVRLMQQQQPQPQPVPFYNQMGVPSNNNNSNFFMGAAEMLPPPPSAVSGMRPPPHMHHHLHHNHHHHQHHGGGGVMGELNERRVFPGTGIGGLGGPGSVSSGSLGGLGGGGGHISIMATNLNPPEHMLHIYPSNLGNR